MNRCANYNLTCIISLAIIKCVRVHCIKHEVVRDSPRLVICHPFPQADEPLVTGLHRESFLIHSNALVALGKVQRPSGIGNNSARRSEKLKRRPQRKLNGKAHVNDNA